VTMDEIYSVSGGVYVTRD